jgi:hypothetical protein
LNEFNKSILRGKIVKNIFVIKCISFCFVIFILLCGTVLFNRHQVYPSGTEIKIINKFFNYKSIKSETDIIIIQNKIVTEISHVNTGIDLLDIKKTFILKQGQCFNRSIILQKFFLMNGYRVRPVFLFWGEKDTTILDFFLNYHSHNIFELYFNGKWVVIETNKKMKKTESIDEYLSSGSEVPIHARYFRYLNNRNGRFIYPDWLPDIYFF